MDISWELLSDGARKEHETGVRIKKNAGPCKFQIDLDLYDIAKILTYLNAQEFSTVLQQIPNEHIRKLLSYYISRNAKDND